MSAGARRPNPAEGVVAVTVLLPGRALAEGRFADEGTDGTEPGFGTGTGVTLGAGRGAAGPRSEAGLMAFGPGIQRRNVSIFYALL